ncbi:MAG TPA: dTDP-glucose 4,6-dehydratase [Planctomycetota bacterium]|nr:dTDP-glucose 4,6-dehydratase [Planctomycetota bacterium]
MKTILVTGGCGFIGSNFVRLMLSRADAASRADAVRPYGGVGAHGVCPGRTPSAPTVEKLINLDLLTYAGNLENLSDVAGDPRYEFVRGDICDAPLVLELMAGVDAVVHFAAESHVDRSILSSAEFIRTNVTGTNVLLSAAREAGVKRFVQVSTDEVYGSLGPTGYFTEETPLAPNSPYSASKASADLLVRAYCHTFGLPAIITRCSNNYGPYQFPEKLIPLFITNLLTGKPVPIYGDGLNVRDWIFVEDHCTAIAAALERGTPGEVYNIGGGNEKTNLDITRLLLAELGRDESSIQYVKDRPGHDRRYAIDSAKARLELGWQPRHDFAAGMKLTIAWYRDNVRWWERIKTGEYLKYYEEQYGKR